MMTSRLRKLAVRSLSLSAAAGAVLLSGGVWSSAQQIGVGNTKQQAKDGMLGKDSTQGVYVRESSTAVDKLVSAQKMERLKEWAKAADYYQEVLQKYNDRVVPTGVDQDNVIDQYGNIKDKVREALSAWPTEGVDAYKARYESEADAILNSAAPDDLNALHKVLDVYFITDAGKRAGLRLMDLSMEAGEFESTARIGDQLLKWHPGLGDDRANIVFETGLAAYYGGQQDKAQEMLQILKTQFPAARGTVRGIDQDLADTLAHEMTAPIAAAEQEGPDSWQTSIGGNSARSQISTAKGRPQARLYDIMLTESHAAANMNPVMRQQLEQQEKIQEAQGLAPGVMPAVDRGELYFQDGRRMYAVNLDSGLPLPGWAQSYPGTGQFVLPDVNTVTQARQLCVTLTDQDALAIMGQTEQINNVQAFMIQQQNPGQQVALPRLACLDRQTGKPRWIAAMAQLPQSAQGLRTLEMIGSPLVVGSNVLVLGRASSQVGFVDCYCVCFDLATGKYRWNCYIASANTNPMMFFGAPGMDQQGDSRFTHPAYADGRVFVQTNVGAIAAIDAYNGSIAWLDLYPTNAAIVGNPWMMQRAQTDAPKPFAGNPVIVSKGKVFSIPSDSDNLLVYDASTGTELKRINLKNLANDPDLEKDMQSPLSFNTLVAVDGDQVILAGAHDKVGQLLSFDWTKYTDQDPAIDWATAAIESIMGRCFVTTDSVFVPMLKHLSRVDRTSGIIVDNYPPDDRSWDTDAGEGPGNVLVTSDRVIVAGSKRVEVYADLSAAHRKLDAAVAAAPTDPNPRLEYAEVMFVSGETDLAATRLDEAMGLLGGKDHLAPGPARDRFFNDSMAFARKLSVLKKQRPEMVDQFFDRAAISANNPAQFVDYYLTRGTYIETLTHADSSAPSAAAAVKLYQKVLDDAALRNVQRPDDKGRNSDAGTLAEAGIDRMIAVDAASYGPFALQAADALSKATDAKADGDTFANIAKTYPNSDSAPKALLAAADAYETGGQSKNAIQVLRQMYFDRKNDQLAPQLLEAMARNYLKRSDHSTSDRLSAAAASLSRAVAIAPDTMLQRPLPMPDGQVLQNQTLSQALAEVRQERGQESAKMLPDFHLPMPPRDPESMNKGVWPTPFAQAGPADVIPDTKALLVPASDYSRPDRVVTQNGQGQLCIYPAMQPDPLMKIDVGGDPLTGSAWSGNNLVAWGPNTLCVVKDGGNQTAWSLKLTDLPEVQADDASANGQGDDDQVQTNFLSRRRGFRGGVMIQNMVIRGGGGLMIGGIPGAAQFGNEAITQVRPVGDRIVCLTSAGRIVAIDAATGKLAWQARPGAGAGTSFVANEDFTVVRAPENAGVRLMCFDTYSGRVLGDKSFSNSAPTPNNMALAADGTLVYTIADRIALKDLFKPWGDQPDKQSPPQPGQAVMSFNPQMAAPENQLIISEGRILALWNDTPYNNPENGSVVVRVFSLDTALPLALHYSTAQGNGQISVQLGAGINPMDISLRTVGSRLYIIGGSVKIISYDLDHPGNSWAPFQNTFGPGTMVSNAFVGKDHVLLLIQPQDPNQMMMNGMMMNGINPGIILHGQNRILNRNGLIPGGQGQPPQNANLPTLGIYAFARYPSAPGLDNESGRSDYTPAAQPSCAIDEPANVLAAQGVDGGICYLSGDNKLHLLHGTEQ
jgi:outer membrane protein assembly factor BamB/tetratricopeptide (TPR) repeat protein